MAKKICCICGKEFNGYGNNPEPVMPIENEKGVRNYCCDWCDFFVVLAARCGAPVDVSAAKEHSDPNFNLVELVDSMPDAAVIAIDNPLELDI